MAQASNESCVQAIQFNCPYTFSIDQNASVPSHLSPCYINVENGLWYKTPGDAAILTQRGGLTKVARFALKNIGI